MHLLSNHGIPSLGAAGEAGRPTFMKYSGYTFQNNHFRREAKQALAMEAWPRYGELEEVIK
jgi:hypothetical protein